MDRRLGGDPICFGRRTLLLLLGISATIASSQSGWGQDQSPTLPKPWVIVVDEGLSPELPKSVLEGPSARVAMLLQEPEAPEQRDLLGIAEQDATTTSGASQVSPVETYGEAPVDRTPQFLRAVTPLLSRGQMQFDYGLVYSLQEADFPVLVGGTILTQADVRRRSLFVPLAMRYGLNERTQLFINAPVGWFDTEFATFAEDMSDSEAGIGDLNFGITRLLCQDNRAGHSLVGTLQATAPTGTPLNPLIVTSGGSGNGVWQLGGDLLVVQNLDPVILFYGCGYAYSFEEEFSGFDVALGHQFSYNLGLGFAANERVTLSTAFQGAYVSETEVDGANLANTDQDLMQLRLAATIAKCHRLIEPFVAFGLTERSPSATVGVVFTR